MCSAAPGFGYCVLGNEKSNEGFHSGMRLEVALRKVILLETVSRKKMSTPRYAHAARILEVRAIFAENHEI